MDEYSQDTPDYETSEQKRLGKRHTGRRGGNKSAQMKRWRQRNPKKYRDYMRLYMRQLRASLAPSNNTI